MEEDTSICRSVEISFDEPKSEMSVDEPKSEMSIGEPFSNVVDPPVQSEEPKVPCPLPDHILPSHEDVLLCYKYKRQSSNSTMDALAGEIAEEIQTIWNVAGIPTLDHKRLKVDITKIIKKGTGNKLSKKTIKASISRGFHNSPKNCFIASICRHFIKAKNKNDVIIDLCDCPEENKIPLSRFTFFQSNLFDRDSEGMLTTLDLPEMPISIVATTVVEEDDDISEEEGIIEDPDDGDYIQPKEIKSSNNMFDYPESVQSIRRTRSSYDTGFQIMNSQLLDLRSHTLSPEILKFLEDHHLSRSKVWNMAKRYGFAMEEEHLMAFLRKVVVLGDDGKKSEVRQSNGRMKKEEKITLMDQHTKKYLDFFIPKAQENCPSCEECTGNCALAHVHALLSKLTKYDLLEVLLGLSLDGENKNTGPNGGIIRRLEILLGM